MTPYSVSFWGVRNKQPPQLAEMQGIGSQTSLTSVEVSLPFNCVTISVFLAFLSSEKLRLNKILHKEPILL